MKKQTTDWKLQAQENQILGFKQGYAKCRADVGKIVDNKNNNHFQIFRVDKTEFERGIIYILEELKQEITRLKGEGKR